MTNHPRLDARASRWKRDALIALGVLLVAMLLDPVLRGWLALDAEHLARVERRDGYRLLRVAGYVPAWIMLGVAVWLGRSRHDPRAPRVGLALVLSAIASGAMAEIVKMFVGRMRPGREADWSLAWYDFRTPLRGFVETSNLGLPSSHAAVAFGGAFAVWLLFPRAGWVALAWAAGCGLTRVRADAHWASDVALGAIVGLVAARLVVWLLGVRGDRTGGGGGGLARGAHGAKDWA